MKTPKQFLSLAILVFSLFTGASMKANPVTGGNEGATVLSPGDGAENNYVIL